MQAHFLEPASSLTPELYLIVIIPLLTEGLFLLAVALVLVLGAGAGAVGLVLGAQQVVQDVDDGRDVALRLSVGVLIEVNFDMF